MNRYDQDGSVRTETTHRVPSIWVPVIVALYHAIGASLTVRFGRDGTATIVATLLGNGQKASGAWAGPRALDALDAQPATRRGGSRGRRSRRRGTSDRIEKEIYGDRRAKN